jgi:hypothetical protein
MLLINFATLDYELLESNRNNVVHELSHMLNAVRGDDLFNSSVNDFVSLRSDILRPEELRNGHYIYWQHNKLAENYETFADMFVAWTFDAWNTGPKNTALVNRARDTMTTNIGEWINR